MSTAKVTRLAEEALSNGPLTSNSIRDYINFRLRHGTTRHSLGNILSKNPKFKHIGKRTVNGPTAAYPVAVWMLA